MQNKRNGLVIAGGLAAMLLLGCQYDEIRSYRVSKPEATRLLAAIMPHADQTWFFKLTGPVSLIDQEKLAFDQFIHSVRFNDQGERPISWAAPPSWRPGPQSGLRYATFYLGPQEHPLELTVTKFSGAAGSVLDNINRWRGQIGLGKIDESKLGEISKNLQLEGGPTVLVDMTSRGGEVASAMSSPDILSRQSESSARPQYVKPEGWKEKPDPKRMRFALFDVADGGAEAGITVFPGAAGGVLDNVNRWRGQVHLEPIDQTQLGKEVRQIDVAGTSAPYVDLTGPASAGGPPQRLLGVILPRGNQTWFFTLKGPAESVGKEKPAFEAFVKSVHFEGGRGS